MDGLLALSPLLRCRTRPSAVARCSNLLRLLSTDARSADDVIALKGMVQFTREPPKKKLISLATSNGVVLHPAATLASLDAGRKEREMQQLKQHVLQSTSAYLTAEAVSQQRSAASTCAEENLNRVYSINRSQIKADGDSGAGGTGSGAGSAGAGAGAGVGADVGVGTSSGGATAPLQCPNCGKTFKGHSWYAEHVGGTRGQCGHSRYCAPSAASGQAVSQSKRAGGVNSGGAEMQVEMQSVSVGATSSRSLTVGRKKPP